MTSLLALTGFLACAPAAEELAPADDLAPAADLASAEDALGAPAPRVDQLHVERSYDGHWRAYAAVQAQPAPLTVELRIDLRPYQPMEDNFFVGWTLDLGDFQVLGLGPHAATARVTDAWGRRATRTVAFTVVPPTSPPELLSVEAGSTVETPARAWVYASAADVDGDLARIEVELDGSGAWLVAETFAPPTGSGTVFYTTDMLGHGPHTVRARAVDAGGRASAPSTPVSFTHLDPTAPACDLDGVVIDTSAGRYRVEGIASDPNGNLSEVEVRLDGGAWMFRGGFYERAESIAFEAYVFPNDPIPAGVHTVEVLIRDAGGLTGTCGPLTFTAANAPSIDSLAGAVQGPMVTLHGTASDADGDLDRVEVKIDDGTWRRALGTASFSLPIGGLPAGTHQAYVRAVDRLGLHSSGWLVQELTIAKNPCVQTPFGCF